MPVRVGTPTNIQGLADMVEFPEYATAVGLIHYGADADLEESTIIKNTNNEGLLTSISQNFKSLIKNFFNLF